MTSPGIRGGRPVRHHVTTQQRTRPCGVSCIVPAYVLEQIARNGSQAQRQRVLSTMLSGESFRVARATGPRPGALATSTGAAQRRVHDCEQTENLPGTLVRVEGDDPTGDAAADEAYDGLGATFDLFADVYGRDSIDGAGMDMVASVHYGTDYSNAFWDGSQMVFGDGDGDLFNRFTLALDVIGHELSHGVIEVESGLVYINQPGALNEHVADVFGSLVKQYAAGEDADEADWLIGEGLFTGNVNGVAIRSMKAPGTAYDDPVLGTDPQPAHMSDYVRTPADSGGVHINSGIPNHAFYLAATAIGGNAWEAAGQIWYNTLLDPRLPQRIGFRGFAALTLQNAASLFGMGSDELAAVREAWTEVGVIRAGTGRAAPPAGAGGRAPMAGADGAPQPWEAGAGEQRKERTQASAPRRRTAARGGGKQASKQATKQGGKAAS